MSDGAYRRAWITSQKSDGADAGDRLANRVVVGDEVAGSIVRVVGVMRLVRLAARCPCLLLQGINVDGAGVGVDLVPALSLGVAERSVHAVDAILDRRIALLCHHLESGLGELCQVGG